jgi:malate permease and related proteins
MEAFQRIFAIIFPVFIAVSIGYGFARWRGKQAQADMVVINRITMDILAPLLIFSELAAEEFNLYSHGTLIFAGTLICAGSALLAWPLASVLRYDFRSFVPTMMYKNAGNMGVPLAVLAFGPSGLSPAVALFVAASVLYFSIGIKTVSAKKLQTISLLKILFSPMMVAMITGVLFAIFHLSVPQFLFLPLKMLGDASIPLMLFSLGVRMLDFNMGNWRIGVVGAFFCPATGLATAWGLDKVLILAPDQRAQMYLFAALPPAVLCFMVAEQYKQEPEKVASIVLIGNLAALVFVPIGLWLGFGL